MSDQLRIVYAGTPEFAVPALSALCNHGHQVVAVYTQPDRRSGRGRKVSFSAVKQAALERELPVQQPLTLRDADARQELSSFQADIMVVAAYGLILPVDVLAMPRLGCLNIHASLLPKWRGAAPIQRAIEAGDAATGVTIMQMAEGLDTGDMLHRKECVIGENTTAAALHEALAQMGAEALLETLEQLGQNQLTPLVQDEALVTYAHKLEKQEAVIDWQASAQIIHRRVCAFNPWPVAQTLFARDTLRVWESQVIGAPNPADVAAGTVVGTDAGLDIATGDGVLRLIRVQAPGKKPVLATDFLNSRDISIGTTFG